MVNPEFLILVTRGHTYTDRTISLMLIAYAGENKVTTSCTEVFGEGYTKYIEAIHTTHLGLLSEVWRKYNNKWGSRFLGASPQHREN